MPVFTETGTEKSSGYKQPSVQAAELNGKGQVRYPYTGLVFQVSNGSRQAQYFVITPCGKIQFFKTLCEELFSFTTKVAMHADFGIANLTIEFSLP